MPHFILFWHEVTSQWRCWGARACAVLGRLLADCFQVKWNPQVVQRIGGQSEHLEGHPVSTTERGQQLHPVKIQQRNSPVQSRLQASIDPLPTKIEMQWMQPVQNNCSRTPTSATLIDSEIYFRQAAELALLGGDAEWTCTAATAVCQLTLNYKSRKYSVRGVTIKGNLA